MIANAHEHRMGTPLTERRRLAVGVCELLGADWMADETTVSSARRMPDKSTSTRSPLNLPPTLACMLSPDWFQVRISVCPDANGVMPRAAAYAVRADALCDLSVSEISRRRANVAPSSSSMLTTTITARKMGEALSNHLSTAGAVTDTTISGQLMSSTAAAEAGNATPPPLAA